MLGGEYGWGTLRPALSRGIGRWQFLASKVAVVVLVPTALLFILSVTVMISGFIAEATLTADPQVEGDGSISWVGLLALFGRMIYGFVPYTMLALFFVVLTGSNGVGLGLPLGYYMAESVILVPVLRAFAWSDRVFAYLLASNVEGWQRTDPNAESSIAAIGGLSDMAHGAVFATLYALTMGAAAAFLFLRRDIAGAKGG